LASTPTSATTANEHEWTRMIGTRPSGNSAASSSTGCKPALRLRAAAPKAPASR
jgi:hypothetical protein